MERVFLTVAGERMLRERLRRLKEFERPKNIQDIEDARAHGDLSENAEYHAAKERQSMIDVNIRDLEDKISRAEVIDTAKLNSDRVVFGAKVVLLDLANDEQVTYQLVGAEEADIEAGRISLTAPLGKALIGKRVGDTVQFRAPGGVREYSVEDLRFE